MAHYMSDKTHTLDTQDGSDIAQAKFRNLHNIANSDILLFALFSRLISYCSMTRAA